jgi:hypothetical protein
VWGATAAAVVGVAVAGGLIVASRSPSTQEPARPAAPTPVTPPTVTAMAPAAAPMPKVRVRVEAPAGANVHAVGAATPLCETPCVVEIDPADGGSTVRRDFVVRAAGFVDAPFTVDLAKPAPTVEVALEAVPVEPPVIELDDPPPSSTGRRRDPGRRDVGTGSGGAVVPPPPPDPGPGSSAKPDGPGPGSGSSGKPKDNRVDPTVTIDPFAGG